MVLRIKIALDVMFTISNTILLLPSRDSLGNFAIRYCQEVPNLDVRDTAEQYIAIIKTGHIICPLCECTIQILKDSQSALLPLLGRLFSHLPVDEHTNKAASYTTLHYDSSCLVSG